jgi:hypothetical protein
VSIIGFVDTIIVSHQAGTIPRSTKIRPGGRHRRDTLWGDQRLAFLRRLLPYARGIPAHDTLNDVINALAPELFKAGFLAWVEGLRDRAPE